MSKDSDTVPSQSEGDKEPPSYISKPARHINRNAYVEEQITKSEDEDLKNNSYDSRIKQGDESGIEIRPPLNELSEEIREIIKSEIYKGFEQEFGRFIQEKENSLGDLEEQLEDEIREVRNREEEIEEIQKEVNSLREEYSQLVQWEAGEAIGAQLFEERKNKLKKSMKIWLSGSILSIVGLILLSMFIYTDISSSTSSSTVMISKVLLIVPVSVAVWFTVSNYTRQKKLMREYEFKEGIAKSMMGFVEAFRGGLSDDEEENVGEFINKAMEKMYSNPQNNIQDGNQEETNPLPKGTGPSILDRFNK